MQTSLVILGIGAALTVFEPLCISSAETRTPPAVILVPSPTRSIPFVATRNDAVRDMLWVASVGKEDVVYDLGSGDGRIVIAAVRDFGARRAVGVEIDPQRIRESRENARKAGVADRVAFIEGDLFTTDFHEASVVTLFVGHAADIRLRPKMFRTLKPGTRIVAHQFGMGEWQPDKTLTVRTVYLGMYSEMTNPFSEDPHVPDYTGNEAHHGTSDKIMMWVVPAAIAGVWRGKIETAEGPEDCQLILHQRLSEVTGTYRLSNQTNPAGNVARADVWGNHVRLEFYGNNRGQRLLRFDGRIEMNKMRGTLEMSDRGQVQQRAWEAQRDKADLSGTWEWPCASGSRSVRLRIERRDGQFVATYLDREQTTPINDFYDSGSGFYFTLLVGRAKNGLRITEDTGWLIGEGVLDHGELKGRIEFYPYDPDRGMPKGSPGVPGPKARSRPVSQDWVPRLIQQ
jgi:SAM-dependent methyltransferase